MTIAKTLNHPIAILALTIVTIVFFLSLNKSSQKTQNSSETISVLEYEVNQISGELIDIEEKIEETESEQFKEKVVRNELLLQKEGEYILQIAENKVKNDENMCDGSNCESLTVANTITEKEFNFSAWRELLF